MFVTQKAERAPSQVSDRFRELRPMIGNTPLLEIRLRWRGRPRRVYAKAENLNMTGSIKDRMSFHILRSAWKEGLLHAGDTLVEATSGNTGISFAAIGRALGHPVTIFMPDWMSRERLALIRSLGAVVHEVSRDEGGFLGCIRGAEDLARGDPRVFLPHQFSNEANVAAHERTTGPEIWRQLEAAGLTPAAFVAGVGTGGTIMGVGRCLRSHVAGVRIHPLQPAESPTLSTGTKVGQHRIQGISDDFIPDILKLDSLDDVISVNDGDAILMARRLAAELGLAVGISSGANFIGALKVLESMGQDAVVATVFPDDNKKYLSTDLLRDEPVRDGYLSPEVELLGYRAFPRVCFACVDLE